MAREARLALEAATLDYAMDEMEPRMAARFESTDQPTRAALAFADRTENSNALMLLHRYEARHTRVWRAALRQLIELQRASSPTRTRSGGGKNRIYRPNPAICMILKRRHNDVGTQPASVKTPAGRCPPRERMVVKWL